MKQNGIRFEGSQLSEAVIYIGDICFVIFMDCGFKKEYGDYVTPYHSHPLLELHAIHQGYALFETEKASVLLYETDMALIGNRVYHRIPACYGKTIKYTLKFTYSYCEPREGTYTGPSLFRLFDERVSQEDYFVSWQKCAWAERSFDDLFKQSEKDEILSTENTKASLKLLFINLIRLVLSDESGIKKPLSDSSIDSRLHHRNVTIKRIEYFFNHNYMNDVVCADLAKELFYSEKQTNRLLQNLFGMGFREMIRDIRLRNARAFLLDHPYPIKKVAEMTGFSLNGLCSAFKKVYGMSPSEYRQMHEKYD